MRAAILSILLLSTALLGTAQARMYQWVSPATGNVQMSGTPPTWYRSEQGGPRVLVFHGGQLVDDTGVPVPEERSRALREEAIRELEERQELIALQRLEKTAQREAAMKELETAEVAERGEAAQVVPRRPGALDDSAISRLKSIITEWDRRQVQDVSAAQELLNPARLRAILSERDERGGQQ